MRPPLVLAVMLLSAAPGLAEEEVPPPQTGQIVEQEAEQPAPQLVQLDSSLLKAQEDKRQGRIDEKGYQEFLTKFRSDLEAAMSLVKPTPVNAALHARLLSRLGDSGNALAALGPKLARDPASPALGVALSQVLYDRKDYPAALAEANSVLARDPSNKAALALKYSSEGRIGTGSVDAGIIPGRAVRAPLATDSPKVQALAPRIRAARDSGDIQKAMTLAQEAMRAAPTSEYAQEIYRSVAKDHARWQRDQNPSIVGGRTARHDPEAPASKSGGIPLWPILPISGLGAAAFVVAKSRRTVESEDGFDEENRPAYGRLQQFVAGAVLAGLAGAGIYLTGATAIPVAARYLASTGKAIPLSGPVGARLGNDEAVVTASRWVKPESGFYDVMLHGSPDRFWINRAGKWIDIDHRSLATFIKKQNNYDGSAIRLLSCQTGSCAQGVAKNLANKLGVPVKAPSDTLYVYDSGRMAIGPAPSKNTGTWKVFLPGEAK